MSGAEVYISLRVLGLILESIFFKPEGKQRQGMRRVRSGGGWYFLL